MDLRKIRKLIDLLQNSDLAELEIKEGEETVRLSRAQVAPAPVVQQVAPAVAPAAPAAAPAPAQAADSANALPQGQPLKSPMVGTFYSASAPGAEPYVKLGQKVSKGDTLGMIEAMKMFNQIEAEISGEVVAILVENGEAVEFDQPLFIIA